MSAYESAWRKQKKENQRDGNTRRTKSDISGFEDRERSHNSRNAGGL